MNWKPILESLHIPYVTNGKNSIPGACTIRCPICGDKPNNPNSKHGNLTADGGYKCWRCNGSSPTVVLSKITGLEYGIVENIIRSNRGINDAKKKEVKHAESIQVPGSVNPLIANRGREYLRNRGFNTDDLEFYFGVKYTDICTQNGQDWSHRVIIPVKDVDGNVVSYQGRDYTGKANNRYLFPSKSNTIMDSKELLYGADLCRTLNRVVVLEGVMDVWKFGAGAVSTFGTSYTRKQVAQLSSWPEVVVAFDNEPEAQKHALELCNDLSSMGVSVVIANVDLGMNHDGSKRDIGDCTQDEIQKLRKSLGMCTK